jgi:Lrp/AsnC family leucine-responsive transcriptional regulator
MEGDWESSPSDRPGRGGPDSPDAGMGIIEAFTVKINHKESGKPLWAFINVSMKSSNHLMFQSFILKTPSIVEAHRISGEGCYWLKANLADQQELNALLDKILAYGNYKLTLSIGQLKSL